MVKKDNPTVLLIDATPDCVTDGIFTKLTNPPWQELNLSPQVLNGEYYLAHSGKKPVAPIVHYYLDDDNEITAEGMTALGALIKAKFYEPWEHLMATYYADYDPLHNYDIEEIEEFETDSENELSRETSYGKTVNTSDVLAHGKSTNTTDELTHGKILHTTDDVTHDIAGTITQSVTYGRMLTTVTDGDSTSESKRYGFNSSAGVPTDSSSSTDDSTVTNTEGGTDGGTTLDMKSGFDNRTITEMASGKDTHTVAEMNSGSDSRTVGEMQGGKDTIAGDGNEHATGTKERSRHGLNGLNSYQRLIAEDRKLWLDNFFDRVYHDIDSVLTLPIYPAKRRLQSWVFNSGYPNR